MCFKKKQVSSIYLFLPLQLHFDSYRLLLKHHVDRDELHGQGEGCFLPGNICAFLAFTGNAACPAKSRQHYLQHIFGLKYCSVVSTLRH